MKQRPAEYTAEHVHLLGKVVGVAVPMRGNRTEKVNGHVKSEIAVSILKTSAFVLNVMNFLVILLKN